MHALIKDLLALCDFYTKKKLVKDKAVTYDESILYKSSKKKDDQSYIYRNDSHSRFVNDNIFENENEDKQSSVSPLRKASVYNYLEDDLSLIERTAQRVKPIIEALTSHLVLERSLDDLEVNDKDLQSQEEKPHLSVKKIEPDMRIVLGYLNQLEMISNLNIGNIMQIVPVKIEDLLSAPRNETEFSRACFIEKISLLCVSYF